MIEVGQNVGNYTIISKLGEGGMGTVYLAEHPVIGRKAALKAIHPQYARDAEIVSRFVTEAKVVNQIGHQHIVDITDFGTTLDGEFYFIMEYLLGDALSDGIKRAGRFPTERALRIAGQIADALQACHDHGVIHRDLKPDNVILINRDDDDDFVKVLDFGLAKLTNAAEAPTHNTHVGSVMGTPYYMAPEQCEGRVEIDHRADIYSLGVILFEMLTGKLPFGGNGYGEIIMKHMTTPPPASRSIVPDLSPALDQILFRALAKDPRDRFQTMSELRRALADPDYFASAVPSPMVADDLSSRVRAAQPMARSEIRLTAAEPSSEPPPRKAPLPHNVTTFGQSVGQVGRVPDLGTPRPKTSHRIAAVLTVATLASLVCVGVKFRREEGRIVVRALSPTAPATVRLNFSSDPDGASVTRADGTVLGVTPLSTDVPFGNVGLEYVLSKTGYLPKTLAAVPNLAAPLFAALERDPRADKMQASLTIRSSPADGAPDDAAEPEDATPGDTPVIAARPGSLGRSAIRGLQDRAHASKDLVDDDPAGDDSMAPTVARPSASARPSPEK